MDSPYRPQSPDLSSYAPESPDLSGYRAETPEAGNLPPPQFGHNPYLQSAGRFAGAYGSTNPFATNTSPTSVPNEAFYGHPQEVQSDMASMSRRTQVQQEPTDNYLTQAPSKHVRKTHTPLPTPDANHKFFDRGQMKLTAPLDSISTSPSDPTLGVTLKTSFPVARIKRIMQADEDVGKVAQVTPQVVSRALELFMIRLISASAVQARGGSHAGTGNSKGPRRVLAQHMKRAVAENETFDFLAEIMSKVPDAPAKGKKEPGSDSEEGGSTGKAVRKKGKKRKNGEDEG